MPAGARVLDIGCGPGDFARELLGKGCRVTAPNQSPPVEASPFGTFITWNEPEPLAVDLRRYDFVLLLDIIEHLRAPEVFLDGLREASPAISPRSS